MNIKKMDKDYAKAFSTEMAIIDCDVIYIYEFDAENEIDTICEKLGNEMCTIYLIDDFEEDRPDLENLNDGFFRFDLKTTDFNMKKRLIQLFLYSSSLTQLNRLFLLQPSEENQNISKKIQMKYNQIIMAPVFDVSAVALFGKACEAVVFLDSLRQT
ncbi:hypothetical protein HCB46_02975 [Listeria ivanovii]|uniref:hypothetical protein n=1 Tax=Listeria ivanovii TaxID=1638 RepID=UPI0016289333|nr:hypothetical protein [Listeria ivanovii]MBC2254432.1 hypothetical protein [Listeria ivanovii]